MFQEALTYSYSFHFAMHTRKQSFSEKCGEQSSAHKKEALHDICLNKITHHSIHLSTRKSLLETSFDAHTWTLRIAPAQFALPIPLLLTIKRAPDSVFFFSTALRPDGVISTTSTSLLARRRTRARERKSGGGITVRRGDGGGSICR